MSQRWPEAGPTPGAALLLAVVLAGAAIAGMMAAVVGSMAGTRAIYYAVVLGFIVVGGLVAVTRREPLRFVFLALILCVPFAGTPVPPGRYELTVFDVVMVLLTIGLLWKRLAGSPAATGPIFPTGSLTLAWLLAVPCVMFSYFPAMSLKMFVLTFAVYTFSLYALEELKREGGFERLTRLLSIALIVVAAGCFIESVLHVNLSLSGTNLNRLSYAAAGFEIYRSGGFFQDGQKAGAWLACMITFLLVLAVRGRLRDPKLRFLAWTGIVLGLGALVTTVSRAAILSCLAASVLALFVFNRWSGAVKVLIGAGAVAAAIVMALIPLDTWMGILPAAVAERFSNSREEFLHRIMIWFDTWNMFADQPMTGIGFGSFRDYLKATQPAVSNYYGLGEAEGVAYVPDNPESGYFKILYEGGILGSLAVLIVVLDALRRALGVVSSSTNPDARTEAIAALAALMVFSVTFVTLFTVSDNRVAALVAFFLALIWHRSLERARMPSVRGTHAGRPEARSHGRNRI
jgi:O-antigen ligase